MDGGKFVSITFTKKDGTERTVIARLGVKKDLKGGVKAYSDKDKNTVTVWITDTTRREDNKAESYRSIRVDSIKQIVSAGVCHMM